MTQEKYFILTGNAVFFTAKYNTKRSTAEERGAAFLHIISLPVYIIVSAFQIVSVAHPKVRHCSVGRRHRVESQSQGHSTDA